MEQSSSSSGSDYTTVWSAPPKKPSGRTKFRETRHPIYRGVRRRGASNRWVCEVRNPSTKSRIWLGTFPTADMAARAHDVAAMVLQGRSACLNFADSAWLITVPSSFSSVKELKQAAIETAEMLHSRNPAGTVESASSSASSTETADETEVASSSSSLSPPVPAPKLEAEDQLNFRWDGFEVEDMNFGTYFASLAEGLMLDPPAGWFVDLDDNRCVTTVSLWN